MAELSTIARPYAKAAFEYADETGQLQQWSDLLATAAALASNEDMCAVIESPALDAEQKVAVFVAAAGKSFTDAAANLIDSLAEHKRLGALPAIAEAFEVFKAEREAALDVEVTSAFELSSEQEAKLAASLRSKWNKDVSIRSQVDTSLIGGVIIRAGDVVIDGSVRGRLAQVAEAVLS